MHKQYFELAADTAKEATCTHAKCGSVIVSRGVVIGRGFNAPPLNDELQRRCHIDIRNDEKPKYDKTCCVHAEWNAIIDALKNHPDKIVGSTLYFMRIDSDGQFSNAGEPFCTVCSRLALQSGIGVFGLWNDGPDMINTADYNIRSYDYYNLNLSK